MSMRDIDGEMVTYSRIVAHQLFDDVSRAHDDFSAAAAEALRLIEACLMEESELLPFAETPLRQYREAIASAFQTIGARYTQDLIPNVAAAIAFFDEADRMLTELGTPDAPLHAERRE